jgi:hypothetical protein
MTDSLLHDVEQSTVSADYETGIRALQETIWCRKIYGCNCFHAMIIRQSLQTDSRLFRSKLGSIGQDADFS